MCVYSSIDVQDTVHKDAIRIAGIADGSNINGY